MKAILLIVIAVFFSVILWRNVFYRKRERKAIRFGIRELMIAVCAAAVVVLVLFVALLNNTWRFL